jgi:uncharacterized protein (TIGR02231 family)
MKKTILITSVLSILFTSVLLFAETAAVPADFSISNVTVYSGRALVERKATLSLSAGENYFAVSDLPAQLMDNTLLVYKGDKEASFLIKEFEFKEIEAAVVLKEEEKKLKDKLNLLTDEQKSKEDRLEVLKAKAKFYTDLTAKSSTEAGQAIGQKEVSVKNISDVLAFAATGLEAVMKEKRTIDKRLVVIKDEINIIQSQLSELYTKNTKRSKVLFIRTASNVAASADIRIKYVVPDAYWYPSYECNYIFDQGVIDAGYYAMISQNTGEKWNRVKLTIASGTPLYDVSLPVPYPWIVDERKNYYSGGAEKRSMMKSAPVAMAEAYDSAAESGLAASAAAPVAATFQQDELNIKANLTGKFDVSDTGEVKKVLIKEMKLKKNEIFYTAVPTQNEAAYLTIDFENNDEMIMVPGEVSLYMDGNYSGKANINANVRKGEKLKFSFGIDENIKLKKEKLQEKKGESGIFGSDKKTDFGYRLTAENYKSKDVTLYIKEPLPFSENDRIKVDVYETSLKPDAIEDRGVYVWKVTLKAGEKKEITYRFKITHPKDMNVNGI